MMKIILAFSFLSFVLLASDPLGQTADYKVDKDVKRTSSMVKSGTAVAGVTQYLESTNHGPAYEVAVDYVFNVSFMGEYKGTQKIFVSKDYFTEEFLVNLRKGGVYDGGYFKAVHKGFADAKNLDGKFYPNCDKVLLYDLKDPNGFFQTLFSTFFDARANDIKDMKALAHIFTGVPVLAAVKLDLSGVYSGQNVKVGADFEAH